MKLQVPFLLFAATFSIWAQVLNPVLVVTPEPESRAWEENRRILVKSGYKQPKSYPGYTGFVGWASVMRTRAGTLLLTFSSGYWHASPPTPISIVKPGDVQTWRKLGMPDVNAPRGGRAEIMRSEDGGKTWSDPVPLIDTEWDDRSPAVAQLHDGTRSLPSSPILPPASLSPGHSTTARRGNRRHAQSAPRFTRSPPTVRPS